MTLACAVAEFAIANVQCQYEGSDTEADARAAAGAGAGAGAGDHTYDLRDEPPAFIIHQLPPMATSGPFVEVRPNVFGGGAGGGIGGGAVNVIHVGEPEGNKRVRRSEVVLRQAADAVSRGSTFQTVSEQFNIPISTIRFFMARKGILPRRRRGRSTQVRTCSSPEPPFQMQHFKLPEMLALRSDDEASNT